jgi:hypothetical protein
VGTLVVKPTENKYMIQLMAEEHQQQGDMIAAWL